MSTVTSQRLPLISVIIPTYNRAALLRRAIDSVYAQEGVGELFDVEVLVIDDGSTDTTPTVASSYEGLRYIRPSTNKGTSGARNVGLDAAVGEYVAFLDDDDSWLPWKLRRQLQVQHPAGEQLLQLEQVPGDGRLQGRQVGADVLHRPLDHHAGRVDLLRLGPRRQ